MADETKTTIDNLVDCPRCGGSGFCGVGSGYDDVCGECGGLKQMPREQLSQTTRARALAAIDDCTPKEIADGLRIAIIAFRIKAERATGRDKQWMRDRASFMAAGILAVNTGGMTL